MALLDFWPSQDRLVEILRRDAEAHSDAVALAVHQPMSLLQRPHDTPIGTEAARRVDENAVLRRLLEDDPDGCRIVLIEGPSGTGKSHVVRWLRTQLRSPEHTPKRLVISVGKGTRLRDIVTALCRHEELAGPEHEALRQRLDRAQEDIEPEDAANRLCNQLGTVCRRHAEQAKEAELQGIVLTPLQTLQLRWGEVLPHILVYEALRLHLAGRPNGNNPGGPVWRLAMHLHSKRDPTASPTDSEFTERDLEFQAVPGDLDRRAAQALTRLQTPANRGEAIQVLNAALDDAKRILLGLDLGLVQEVFRSIRRVLLQNNKELVLLIEDFADLSGLQNEVLQAAIQNGVVDGRCEFCTLRTALAYTDTFIQASTVLSRAGYVFYVPRQFGEKEVLTRSERLIASYLRAARLGSAALEVAFGRTDSSRPSFPPAPTPNDEVEELLKAFGEVDGIPLFPFNPQAIARLLRDRYHGQEELAFVPRDIITGIMKDLLQHRAAFERGEFPSDAFKPHAAAVLSAEQAMSLAETVPNGDARRPRLERLLRYWGADPRVAKAFGISLEKQVESELARRAREEQVRLETEKRIRKEEEERVAGGIDRNGVRSRSEPPRPAQQGDFPSEETKRTFQHWREGTDIAEIGKRGKLRKAIDEALRPALAWAWEPRKPPNAETFKRRWSKWQEAIDVAGVRRDENLAALTLVTADQRASATENPLIADELANVYESNPEGSSWDFAGSEVHLAVHSSFIERHRGPTTRHLAAMRGGRSWDALAFAVVWLQRTGAVFGIPGAGSHELHELIPALLADGPQPEIWQGASVWTTTTLNELRELRLGCRKILRDEIGAFQGTGEKMHALDVARLHALLPKTKQRTLEPPTAPPQDFYKDYTLEEARTFKLGIRVAKELEAAVETEFRLRQSQLDCLSEFLGNSLASQAASEFSRLLEVLRAAGLIAEGDATIAENAIALLQAPLAPAELRKKLSEKQKTLWERLVALGETQEKAKPLQDATEACRLLTNHLGQLEAKLSVVEGADPREEASLVHEQQLKRARELLSAAPGLRAEQSA